LQPLHADERWRKWEQETERRLSDPRFAELDQLLERYAETGQPSQLMASQ